MVPIDVDETDMWIGNTLIDVLGTLIDNYEAFSDDDNCEEEVNYMEEE